MVQTSAVVHDTDYFSHCLAQMRQRGGAATTPGLAEHLLHTFLSQDAALRSAIKRAYGAFQGLETTHSDLLDLDEAGQIARIQDGYLNFYATDEVNPYVALAAQGPWIVTLKGAVVYDCGGYGMLGLGHAPEGVLAAMSQAQVMANIMTPSISQMTLIDCLRKEIGHSRDDGGGFARFLCLNSGSEAVTIGSRIADINAKHMTDSGGRHAGKPLRSAALKGSFHGRTDRPAHYSDSSMNNYRTHLASFRDTAALLTIEPNNIASLEATFKRAEEEGFYIEALLMEPVMGEGNPGLSITPAFYERARELSQNHGSLFLVDSIQAGLRANGVLSIIDYPGFQALPPPDMEVYSKALNGGQFPLSILAMSRATADIYQRGLYGNTMTSNPRAADVAAEVLRSITPQVRENIVQRGRQLLAGLESLADELDGAISSVQGTGLLLSCELTTRYKCSGAGSTEEFMRQHGLGVIHGGANSLRFTPGFLITEPEIELILAATRTALIEGPGATLR